MYNISRLHDSVILTDLKQIHSRARIMFQNILCLPSTCKVVLCASNTSTGIVGQEALCDFTLASTTNLVSSKFSKMKRTIEEKPLTSIHMCTHATHTQTQMCTPVPQDITRVARLQGIAARKKWCLDHGNLSPASQVAQTWHVNSLWKEGGQLYSLDKTEEEAQKVRQKGHREQTHGKSLYLVEIG